MSSFNEYLINYFTPYKNLKDGTKNMYIRCLSSLSRLCKNNINSLLFLNNISNICRVISLNYENLNTIKIYYNAVLFIYKNDPLFDKSLYDSLIIERDNFITNYNMLKMNISGGSEASVKYFKSVKLDLQKELVYFVKLDDEEFDKITKSYVDKLSEYMILHFYINLSPLTKYDLFNFVVLIGNIPCNYHNINFLYYSPMNKFMQLYYNNYKDCHKNGSVVEELDGTTYRLIRHYMKVYKHYYNKEVEYLFNKNGECISAPSTYLYNLLFRYFNKKIKIDELL